ncbi:hypothetical protein GCM10010391_34350 [Streptomyces anthocyanicus]|nr:hypothetical protein GCM10010391_34350 [Streptomyces anthocyanicus]
MRQALRELFPEGRLRRRGRGTVVAGPKPAQPLSLAGRTEGVRRQGAYPRPCARHPRPLPLLCRCAGPPPSALTELMDGVQVFEPDWNGIEENLTSSIGAWKEATGS